MSYLRSLLLTLFVSCTSADLLYAQATPVPLAGLRTRGAKAETVEYKGRPAVRVSDIAPADASDGVRTALIPNIDLQDGTIEVDLAGDTLPGAGPEFRGFTGIVFRADLTGSRYECFYLRPKNGRSQDQLQRNHSVQYISNPEFPWQRLRAEFPAKYESYVDLVPGEWTSMKIEVQGGQARLYVHGAAQPVLIVNDLKHGISRGAIGLWIGPQTVAHFANLRVTPH